MGEHGTWFDYLNRFSWWQSFNEKAGELLGRKWTGLAFQDSHFTLSHVLITMVVLGFVVYGGLRFKAGLASADGGLVPPRKMTLRNFFEVMTESVYGMVEGAMGDKNAKRFFPLVGTLWWRTEFGPHGAENPPGDYDYRRFIAGIEKEFPKTRFFMSWNAKWSLAANQFTRELLAHPAMLNREDLPRALFDR